MTSTHRQQLHLLWPEYLLTSPPRPVLPTGYELRTFRPGDEAGYLKLMAAAGFDTFDQDALKQYLGRVLPDGFFVIVYRPTGQIVATSMAIHHPLPLHG